MLHHAVANCLCRWFGATASWSGFTSVWSATIMSSLGDGIMAAAGPLLAASLTDGPRLISGSFVATTLPYALFSLPAGLLLDRVDVRRALIAVEAVRASVLAGLTAALHAVTRCPAADA